jgi:3'(2'), 5'-bisphosphate nucleotidase
MHYEAELKVALEAARRASEAIRRRYVDFVPIPNAPASITTEVDRVSQDIILETLRQAWPADAFCAEEVSAAGARVAGSGPRLWVVDPIDGTRGFARKNDEFSVMFAFLHQGALVVGVVAEPAHGRLTWAVNEGGCWRQDGEEKEPTRCRVSTVDALGDATVVQTRSRDPGRFSEEVRALHPRRVLETYSAGIKLAMVARAEADVYVNNYTGIHDWDIAAGHILVTEAGGTVTGLGGEDVVYGQEGSGQNNGLLASNGLLHDLALHRLATLE